MRLGYVFTIFLLASHFLAAQAILPSGDWRLNRPEGGIMVLDGDVLRLTAVDPKVGAVVFASQQPTAPGKIYRLSLQASGIGSLEAGVYLYSVQEKSFLGRVPRPMEVRRLRGAELRTCDYYLTIPAPSSEASAAVALRPCLRVREGEVTIHRAELTEVESLPPVVNYLDHSRRMDNEWLPVYTEPNLVVDHDFKAGKEYWHIQGEAKVDFRDREMLVEITADNQKVLIFSEPIEVEPGENYILTGLYQSQSIGFGTFGELLVVPEERAVDLLAELDQAQIFSSFSGRELYNRRAGDWQRVVMSYKVPDGVRKVRLAVVQRGRPCQIRWTAFYFGLGPWEKDNRSREYDWNKYVNNLDPLLPEAEVKEALERRQPVQAWLDKDEYPRIMINGEVKAPLIYFGDAFKPSRSKLQDFQQAGVGLQLIPLLRPNRYWRGYRDYDFSAIDEAIWDNVRRNPQGYFMIILSMTPYDSWLQEFPFEVALDASGVPTVSRHGRPSPPCYWSKVYQEQALHYIESAVKHMRQQPYFKAIAGFFLSGNEDGQFYYQISRQGRLEDGYSPAVLPAFRDWLRQRYGTVEALRQSWGQPTVDFETAVQPNPQRERGAVFFDPSTEMPAIDLTRFLNEGMGTFANAMCQTAKAAAGKPVLSLMWWGRGGSLMVYPHFAQTRCIFPSDALDFMGAQPGYRGERHAGCSVFQSWVTDSARSHGKVMMCEADFRTWTSPVNSLLHDSQNVRFWSEYDLRGVLWRELGRMLSVGGGLWFYDMTAGWFKDPAIMREVAAMQQVADKLVQRRQVFQPSEILLVSDEDNYYASTEQLNIWNGPNFHCIRKNQRAWLRSGLKFDFYYFQDLPRLDMRNYKMVVFLNAFFLSTEKKQFITEKLQRDNKVLVWLYAPGYMTERGFSTASMGELTGINVLTCGEVEREAVFVDSVVSRGLAGSSVGMDNKLGQLGFAVDDAAATPIMRYRRSGLVAGAMRDFESHRSVYLALPVSFSPEFLQQLASYADAHVYNRTPGDFFMHRRSDLIALHGVEGNVNRLVLPKPEARLQDLLSGEWLPKENGEFQVKLQPGETRLLEVVGY